MIKQKKEKKFFTSSSVVGLSLTMVVKINVDKIIHASCSFPKSQMKKEDSNLFWI